MNGNAFKLFHKPTKMTITYCQNKAEFIINSISIFQIFIVLKTPSQINRWKEIYHSKFSEFLQNYMARITVIYYQTNFFSNLDAICFSSCPCCTS